jgi:hypothetical protein
MGMGTIYSNSHGKAVAQGSRDESKFLDIGRHDHGETWAGAMNDPGFWMLPTSAISGVKHIEQ